MKNYLRSVLNGLERTGNCYMSLNLFSYLLCIYVFQFLCCLVECDVFEALPISLQMRVGELAYCLQNFCSTVIQ